MRILVLCNSSFVRGTVRLGLQQLALEWSRSGALVDYLSCPTTAWDILSPSRRLQWRLAWLRRGKVHVEENLTEFAPRAPFSRRRRWWFSSRQIKAYSSWVPCEIRNTEYDLCVFDVSYPALFLERISARKLAFRVNDHPDGLLHHMSPIVTRWFEQILRGNSEMKVFPVSDALKDWALGINPNLAPKVFRNGVDLSAFADVSLSSTGRSRNSAVYLGSFNPWFDWQMLFESAKLLSGWRIDLYGPLEDAKRLRGAPSNLSYRGVANFEEVPDILSRYEVGLLPFKDSGTFLDYFDPLKACQYWAAGLGVAATDHPGIRKALGDWASCGIGASGFSQAIVSAGSLRESVVGSSDMRQMLVSRDWPSVASSILAEV